MMTEILRNRLLPKEWHEVRRLEKASHGNHREVRLAVIPILTLNKPHTCRLVPTPCVVTECVPPHERHGKVFTSILEGKQIKDAREGIAGHREGLVSSIPRIYEDHILSRVFPPPAPSCPDMLSTKAMHTTVITGRKEGARSTTVEVELLIEKWERLHCGGSS